MRPVTSRSMIRENANFVNRPALPHRWPMLLEAIMFIFPILTIEEIEQETRLQFEKWQRRLELVEAYRDQHITENELLDALLLLALRAPYSDPSISFRAGSERGEGGGDGF